MRIGVARVSMASVKKAGSLLLDGIYAGLAIVGLGRRSEVIADSSSGAYRIVRGSRTRSASDGLCHGGWLSGTPKGIGAMTLRHSLRTLLLLGLGGVIGGSLVLALGARREAGAALRAKVSRCQARGRRPERFRFAGGRKGRDGAGTGGRTMKSGRSMRFRISLGRRRFRWRKRGEVFDLGMTYSRRSYKWPGHSPGEIITFRSPDGVHRMKDADAPPLGSNPDLVFWHSAAMFISDNVATQIDGLGHITAGADYHWYNGFKESEWGGDWGPRKCDASTIPPIIARGVLIDVAAFKKVDALPGHTRITRKDLEETLAWEGVSLTPGDVVLVRTGTGPVLGRRRRRPCQDRRARLGGRRPRRRPSGWSRNRGRSWSGRTRRDTRSTRARLAGHRQSRSIAICWSIRACTWASFITWKVSARRKPIPFVTSPRSTRSREPRRGLPCGRWRCDNERLGPAAGRRESRVVRANLLDYHDRQSSQSEFCRVVVEVSNLDGLTARYWVGHRGGSESWRQPKRAFGRGRIYDDMTQTIGNTPLVRVRRVTTRMSGDRGCEARELQSALVGQGSDRRGDDRRGRGAGANQRRTR